MLFYASDGLAYNLIFFKFYKLYHFFQNITLVRSVPSRAFLFFPSFFLSFFIFLTLRPNLPGGLCPGVLYHSIHDNHVLSIDFTNSN